MALLADPQGTVNTRAITSLLPVAALLGLATPALTGTATAQSSNETVIVKDFTFIQQNITIPPGGSVTWVHRDGIIKHTVSEENGAWDSHPPPECEDPFIEGCWREGDADYTRTFEQEGVVRYICRVHPNRMRATVTVTSDPLPTEQAAVSRPEPGGTNAILIGAAVAAVAVAGGMWLYLRIRKGALR